AGASQGPGRSCQREPFPQVMKRAALCSRSIPLEAPMTPTAPRFIVCCDWSKEATGRAVFVADLPARTVRYVGPDPKHTQDGEPWSFEAALSLARSLRQEGPVLLTFDAPLGVPQSYLNAARQVPTWQGVRDFVEW